MKKAVLLLAFAFVGFQQQEKSYNVSMNLDEWNVVISTIDDASLPGNVRKSIIQKIRTQLMKQLNAEKAAQDSSKSKIPGGKGKK